ncbi:MAG: tetratricopeptide repeat protein, partial [Candidatus Omnitrophica bacterium]|nr:tetratricopeptide repeat protein [Candidatus Omnitrophota bacterium]
MAMVFFITTLDLAWAREAFGAPTSVAVDDGASLPPSQISIDDVTIPQEYGQITETYKGDDRLVIHIQDLHTHTEAQDLTTKIIAHLKENYKIDTIFHEGAEGLCDTLKYANMGPREKVERATRFFMEDGHLVGAEYAAITDTDLKLYGVEDGEIYLDNLRVYQESETPMYNARLKKLKEVLPLLEEKLSPKIKELGDRYALYEEGGINLDEHLLYLKGKAEELTLDLSRYSNITTLIEIVRLEGRIDFNETQQDLNAFVGYLSQKLDATQKGQFLRKTTLFNSYQITESEYYGYLAEMMVQYRLESAYPNLSNYFKYNALNTDLNQERLLDELDNLYQQTKENLYQTDSDRRLDMACRYIRLVIKLFQINLTRKELKIYEKLKGTNISHLVYEFLPDQEIDQVYLDEVCRHQELFYEYALKRDESLTLNSIRRMEAEDLDKAILIAGGFHTSGITELLKARNYSYIVISPSITTVFNEARYKSLLKDRDAQLDKLINQEALILALLTGGLAPATSVAKLDQAYSARLNPPAIAAEEPQVGGVKDDKEKEELPKQEEPRKGSKLPAFFVAAQGNFISQIAPFMQEHIGALIVINILVLGVLGIYIARNWTKMRLYISERIAGIMSSRMMSAIVPHKAGAKLVNYQQLKKGDKAYSKLLQQKPAYELTADEDGSIWYYYTGGSTNKHFPLVVAEDTVWIGKPLRKERPTQFSIEYAGSALFRNFYKMLDEDDPRMFHSPEVLRGTVGDGDYAFVRYIANSHLIEDHRSMTDEERQGVIPMCITEGIFDFNRGNCLRDTEGSLWFIDHFRGDFMTFYAIGQALIAAGFIDPTRGKEQFAEGLAQARRLIENKKVYRDKLITTFRESGLDKAEAEWFAEDWIGNTETLEEVLDELFASFVPVSDSLRTAEDLRQHILDNREGYYESEEDRALRIEDVTPELITEMLEVPIEEFDNLPPSEKVACLRHLVDVIRVICSPMAIYSATQTQIYNVSAECAVIEICCEGDRKIFQTRYIYREMAKVVEKLEGEAKETVRLVDLLKAKRAPERKDPPKPGTRMPVMFVGMGAAVSWVAIAAIVIFGGIKLFRMLNSGQSRDLRKILDDLGYPRGSQLAINREFERLFAEIDFSGLQREAASVRGSGDIEELRSFLSRLETSLRGRGYMTSDPKKARPLIKLFTTGLDSTAPLTSELVRCAAVSQMALVLLKLLKFDAYGARARDHAFDIIELAHDNFMIVDFSLGIMKVVNADRYTEEGAYSVLGEEHRVSPERLHALRTEFEQDRLVLDDARRQITDDELMHTAYFAIKKFGDCGLTPVLYALIGFMHYNSGDVERAIERYEMSTELDPDDSESRYNLGTIYSSQGDYQKAIEELKIAVGLNPHNTKAHFNLGNVYRDSGDYQNAITAYKESIRKNPEDVDSYVGISAVYVQAGHYPEAIEACQKAIRKDPRNIGARQNLGGIYGMSGNHERACVEYETALRYAPENTELHYNYSMALAMAGDLEGAIAPAQKAVQLDPGNGSYLYHRGVIYDRMGSQMRPKAIESFAMAARVDRSVLGRLQSEDQQLASEVIAYLRRRPGSSTQMPAMFIGMGSIGILSVFVAAIFIIGRSLVVRRRDALEPALISKDIFGTLAIIGAAIMLTIFTGMPQFSWMSGSIATAGSSVEEDRQLRITPLDLAVQAEDRQIYYLPGQYGEKVGVTDNVRDKLARMASAEEVTMSKDIADWVSVTTERWPVDSRYSILDEASKLRRYGSNTVAALMAAAITKMRGRDAIRIVSSHPVIEGVGIDVVFDPESGKVLKGAHRLAIVKGGDQVEIKEQSIEAGDIKINGIGQSRTKVEIDFPGAGVTYEATVETQGVPMLISAANHRDLNFERIAFMGVSAAPQERRIITEMDLIEDNRILFINDYSAMGDDLGRFTSLFGLAFVKEGGKVCLKSVNNQIVLEATYPARVPMQLPVYFIYTRLAELLTDDEIGRLFPARERHEITDREIVRLVESGDVDEIDALRKGHWEMCAHPQICSYTDEYLSSLEARGVSKDHHVHIHPRSRARTHGWEDRLVLAAGITEGADRDFLLSALVNNIGVPSDVDFDSWHKGTNEEGLHGLLYHKTRVSLDDFSHEQEAETHLAIYRKAPQEVRSRIDGLYRYIFNDELSRRFVKLAEIRRDRGAEALGVGEEVAVQLYLSKLKELFQRLDEMKMADEKISDISPEQKTGSVAAMPGALKQTVVMPAAYMAMGTAFSTVAVLAIVVFFAWRWLRTKKDSRVQAATPARRGDLLSIRLPAIFVTLLSLLPFFGRLAAGAEGNELSYFDSNTGIYYRVVRVREGK